MKKEAQYAQALFALVSEHPNQGKDYVSNLQKVLASRKERALLPRILAEVERLQEGRRRLAHYHTTTPHDIRSRALVELYRTLIATN